LEVLISMANRGVRRYSLFLFKSDVRQQRYLQLFQNANNLTFMANDMPRLRR
jgi:hypothetical protein